MCLKSKGYQLFKATEVSVEKGDGQQKCSAVLTVTLKEGAVLPEPSPSVVSDDVSGVYSGDTKHLRGHAEIDAVFQFLKATGWNKKAFELYDAVISCPAKPVCVRCAAMLGLLGVTAAENQTKTPSAMGKTSYSAPTDLVKYLADKQNVLPTDIRQQIFDHAY